MAVKKKGLGRGLDALFPEKSVKPAEKKPEQKPVATNESLHQQEEGSLNASAVKSAAETKDTAQAAVVEEPKKSEMLVKISKVEPNRTQPRMQFDEDALLELSESIKQFGILQPLLVSNKGDYYEIIAGERRWRAAKLAGVKEVPVIIKEFNDQHLLNSFIQFQKAKGISHCSSALRNAFCNIILFQLKFVDQTLIGHRFLYWI